MTSIKEGVKLNYLNIKIDPMNKTNALTKNEFIEYLSQLPASEGHIPSLFELSSELGISIARLREQLEVAKSLGLVKIRPRTGMERLEYNFLPPVRLSLDYAMRTDPASFEKFADLRRHLEASYWLQAVKTLTAEDVLGLQSLITRAWDKLRGSPIQIPYDEHRELHLSVYRRLCNPFVIGILEAYWDAYERVGLNLYADYHYLEEVWTYHQKMVEAIAGMEYEIGYQALVEHNDLLHFMLDSHQSSGAELNDTRLTTNVDKE